MALWLILTLMTMAAVFAVIWPLARNSGTAYGGGTDTAVYRDQLDELERDRAEGLIAESDAGAARVEISRRLLAATDAAQATRPVFDATAAVRRRAVAVASLIALPIIAGGLYFRLGSPELASAQLLAQHNAAPAQQSIESLVAQAEAHLARNPEDGHGWEILAPVYMRLDRYTDSVTAWRNALQLLGESADRDANLGEALTAEANGVVTADAKAVFLRAVTLDQTDVTARYYLGLAAEQDGKRNEAAKIWRDLIAEAPAGAPWINDIRNALARVENNSTSPLGPNAPQIAGAANQPPEQQAAMIRGMVDRLATRLKQDGSDIDGWVRLVRSYKVLGEPEKARAAAADAERALADAPERLQQLNSALKELDASAIPAAAPSLGAGEMAGEAATPKDHPQGVSVQDMVERLAKRLNESGLDPEGWLMLVRSYVTLNESDKATAAINNARRALAEQPEKLEIFNEALKSAKIEQ